MKSKKWLIGLGLAVVLVVAFALPACEGPGPGEEPVHRLTVGVLTDVPSLVMDQDELEHSNVGCIYKRLVYETLTEYFKVGDKVPGEPDLWYDPNAFLPKLATGVDVTYENRFHPTNNVTQPAQVWTLHLREDVKWHDGVDFTAEDVKFSCENAIGEWDPSNPICWEYYWDTWDPVWWLNIVDDHTIEFIYEHNITEAHYPAIWSWSTCIIPKHVFGPEGEGVYENWDEDPRNWDGEYIGTGAYKVAEYKPNQYHRWVRNDDWWGEDVYGPVEIEELIIKIFPSTESLTAAFEAGEIDTYMASFSYASIPSFLEHEDITVEVVPGIGIYYMGFNLYAGNETYNDGILRPEVNPLHDKALRKAIAYAIDAEKMIDMVLGGDTYLDQVEHGDLTAYGDLIPGWIYPEMTGYNPDLEMYAYDIDKAADLLTAEGYTQNGEAAGYKDQGYWVSPYTSEEITLELRTSTAKSESDTGAAIKEDLEAFGIHINFLTVETTTYLEQEYQPWSNGWDLFVGEEEPSADPVADWIWEMITDPWGWGWGWAPTYWCDAINQGFGEEFEKLFTAADPNVPRRELQAIANEELPMYMLYREHVISAYWTDRWTGWYNELGGPFYWFNIWNAYRLHWVGD